ncbi:hypothetical protein [Burkholderia glumae]|uniref:hypothetical protein n=1 Tax=Burkholderia glumae TaxID=337 RepID=UPI0020369AB4|nr:hypothetical protein [Burkholderia glumae]MCM2547548.1 hypothetical protein [Burkholderia glumae]
MNWHCLDRLLHSRGPRRITACLPSSETSPDVVEEGIWPLVRSLNQVNGVRTIASCHGHRRLARVGFKVAPWILRPYVFFEGPATFALTLSELIDHARWQSKLNYTWQVSGATHPDLGQCISLILIGRFQVGRKLASDLASLAELVASQTGDSGNAVARVESNLAESGQLDRIVQLHEPVASKAPACGRRT